MKSPTLRAGEGIAEQNVELVWQLIEAVRLRDAEAIDALWHPEGEFRSAFGAMEGRTYRGSGMYRGTGTGKGSGVRIDADIAIVYTFRDGLVWRGDVYLDQAEAFDAVELKESDTSVS